MYRKDGKFGFGMHDIQKIVFKKGRRKCMTKTK